ncbi:MAG: T9SS type A sorting domain-containing protein [Chitinophagales bacterium]
MHPNHKKINSYSAFAVAFIAMQNGVDGQAVYTDIDPDIEIQFDGQTAGIDMDNNGTFDFGFLIASWSYNYWNGSSETLRQRRRIWVGPQFISNEIAGDYFYPSAGGSILYHPYAFSLSSNINEDLSFQYWGSQIMAGAHKKLEIPDDWNFDGGHWIYDEESHYLGVSFYDEDACLHYGWIRCIVKDTANILIIQEYAYESNCETGIKAGDVIGDTTVAIQQLNSLNATIYSFNNTIYINLNESFNSVQIRIYDLNGKVVYADKLKDQFEKIELNEAKGMYVVELVAGENKCAKKVYLVSGE